MPIPEPTRQLVAKLKQTALLFDAVATQVKTDKAYSLANNAANTIWQAINRIEDLAQAIEDMAPTFHREPSDEQTDDARDNYARDFLNERD